MLYTSKRFRRACEHLMAKRIYPVSLTVLMPVKAKNAKGAMRIAKEQADRHQDGYFNPFDSRRQHSFVVEDIVASLATGRGEQVTHEVAVQLAMTVHADDADAAVKSACEALSPEATGWRIIEAGINSEPGPLPSMKPPCKATSPWARVVRVFRRKVLGAGL